MKPLKAVLVNKLYYPVIGGVETHVRDLALHLPHEIERKVLACSETKKRKVELVDGVEVIKASSLGIFFSSPLPISFIGELKKLEAWADIFHFHFPFPPGEVSFLFSQIKKPLVVTYHSDIVRQKALLKVYYPFLKKFLEKARVIIATSPAYVRTSPILSAFSEKCRVVPLGIDTRLYELNPSVEAQAEKIKEEVGAPFVLFVGRLIYYKGVEYLIRAFASIPEPFKLVLVGQGILKDSLEKLAEDAGVSHRVLFYEPQPFERLLAFYQACEVFVLPSVERSEAFGIVQLEAQACGKPVVSTELGTGTSFANLNGVTGYVVPPKQEAALAHAINELLQNEDLRREMGRKAKERVQKEFDVRVMAYRVAEIYEEVAS